MELPRWMALAWAEFGVAEHPGPADNPRILEYLARTTLGAPANQQDETPWCAAFACWVLEAAGYRSPRSAAARAFAAWGSAAPGLDYGVIAVLTRPPSPTAGHVGFVVGWTPTRLALLGGNQGDRVSVAAYARERLLALRVPAA